MKNKFVVLMLIVVLVSRPIRPLLTIKILQILYNREPPLLRRIQVRPTKLGLRAAMQVKMNLMLLLAHNSRINHSMIVKKGTMLDFYQIRLIRNQYISNTAFLVVKRLWVFLIMLVTVLSIKQSHWQRLNVSMDITAANN
jgi:hypothetical protein